MRRDKTLESQMSFSLSVTKTLQPLRIMPISKISAYLSHHVIKPLSHYGPPLSLSEL